VTEKKRTGKRFVEAEDICRLNVITSVAMSPDENKIAYTVETISDDRKRYFSHIHVIDCDLRESRQFTFGEVSDRGLAWSPDGKYIAFISSRDKKTGIFIIPSEGGAEREVMQLEGTVMSLVWTPDSRELVYAFRYSDSHYIKDKEKKKEAPLYRHITSIAYRTDGVGFIPKDHFHIWKLNVENQELKQLTRGKYDDLLPAISPDGKWIAFCSKRVKVIPPINYELFLIPINGGKGRLIPTPRGLVWAPVFSPDGKTIAYIGRENDKDTMGVVNVHIWKVGIRGKPVARDLTPTFNRSANNYTIGDIGDISGGAPFWSHDSKHIFFIATDTGSSHVLSVSSSGGRPVKVTRKKCHVKAYSANGRRRRIAAVVSDLKTPAELHLIPATAAGDTNSPALMEPNKQLFSIITFPDTKEVWFKASDGADLQGWLVTPPKMNRKRMHPAILQIHGGPVVQYGFTFFHEMLYLASNGYVVFYTNPRDSTGRGEAFAETVNDEWGTKDGYNDLMAAADYLERLPYVDKKRMGVTGGSYGGFMTNWIVGHTHRFRAAVTQRSLANMVSLFGLASGDMGRGSGRYPWTDPEWYARVSPLTYAKNIKTPLLIIHSENDLGPKIEQAEQLFTTLKLMKKKVEFVRFPEESHGLSRHGRPDRRIARLEWILRWFDKYLK